MAVKIHLKKKTITLGVGDIVAEPVGPVGRVAGLSTWTRLAMGREAHTNHQRAQAETRAGYRREIVVKHRTKVDEFDVTVQGRIDGIYGEGEWVIEEIKSVVAPAMVFAALHAGSYPHYTEQLRLYCFFAEHEGQRVEGRLVFVNVADGARREVAVTGPFEDCAQLIADRVRLLLRQATETERHREARRATAGALTFPHDKPRRHQDELIAAVERAFESGRHLLVSAPSGIGKTAGTLFPALQDAFRHDRRIFFVTAKNTQQQIALETLRKIESPTATFFRAREKMCINDVYACREEFCPHLRDFSLKLEKMQTLSRLLGQRLITPEAMMEEGRLASLCPFELALLEAEQTDVIVCDYNYVFDPQVYFRRFFQEADYSDAILIIDEAHNLAQRAMDYYSPVLERRQVEDLRANLRHVTRELAGEIKNWLGEVEDFFARTAELSEEAKFQIESPRPAFEELKSSFTRLSMRYVLEKITGGRAIPDDPVEDFFAVFGQFCAVLALEGKEFSYIFDGTAGQSLKILCKDPSRQLAERINGFHSVVAMSATLVPVEFHRQMLGFDPARTDEIALPSPFPAANRKILIEPSVLTTYRSRGRHYGQIADIIATTARARRGNYMALFPSYEFLRAVVEELSPGKWELRVQEPRMGEAQREELLEALKRPEPPKLVLAVQGGLFAEGVDYPGELLSGVIVVSPALPQVNYERELIRRYYDEEYGKGFEFAYLYPGMSRVIQSVGRLIRTETDTGVAVLVCRRFAQPQYAAMFPADWRAGDANSMMTRDLQEDLEKFWTGVAARPGR